jgi:ABC-type transport system substrate-binding protein
VLPTSTYYTSPGGYLTRYLGQDIGSAAASLTAAYITTTWSGAPFDETHWGDQKAGGAAADKLMFEAAGTIDAAKASDLWSEVQRLQVEQGGYINWGNGDSIDAVASNVRGLRESVSFNLNNYRMLDGWLAGK